METKQHSNIEAEMQVVGSLLVENGLCHRMKPLAESDFSDPVIAAIYAEIIRRVQQGGLASAVTMKDWAIAYGLSAGLDEGFMIRLLVNLTASAVMPMTSILAHVDAIAEASQKRALSRALAALSAEMETDATPAEIAARAMVAMQQVLGKSTAGHLRNSAEVGREIVEDFKRDLKPISTGIPLLDQAMGGGMMPGYTYGFIARKKVGKTVLASTISSNLNYSGIRHLFVCGEMGMKQIHQRVLARRAKIDPSKFRGLGSPHDRQWMSDVANVVYDDPGNCLYHNAPGMSFHSLKQGYLEAVCCKKVQVVILDYWQLVGGKGKGQSTAEHLDEVAQWLADTGRRYEVANIIMAQANQEGNTRGSEGLKLACDQAYQIHRPDTSLPGVWLEMEETRYTPWQNIGSEEDHPLQMNPQGPWFQQGAAA